MGDNKDHAGNPLMKLDTPSIEDRARRYPADLQEPYVWLCCYLREECARDLDLLTERAGKLGITFDKTTWSRVIRGRWNTDAEGHVIDTPIVAMPKLIRAIDALRKDSRIKEQGGRIPFVVTTVAQSIWDYIDTKRASDRVCKFGVVIGETGNQKTASFREYCRRNNHGACSWVDAPETPNMTRFKTDLAFRYGAPVDLSTPRKEIAIRRAVNDRRTIIVENVQRLYDPRAEGNQPIFNYLQKLQEDTGCTVIISFTPTFERTFTSGRARGFFEQFEGRAGGNRTFLRLEEFPPEEDVIMIAEAFKLREAAKHQDYLVKLSREPGRIRILFETLQSARIHAERKSQPLTISHLKHVRDED